MNLFSYDNSIDTVKLNNYIEKVREEIKDDSSFFKILLVKDEDIKTDKYLLTKTIDNSVELDTAKFLELLNYEYRNSLAFRAGIDGLVSLMFKLQNDTIVESNIDKNIINSSNYNHSFLTILLFNIFNKSSYFFIKKNYSGIKNNIIDINLLFTLTEKGKKYGRCITPIGQRTKKPKIYSKIVNKKYKIELSFYDENEFNKLTPYYKNILTNNLLDELSQIDFSSFKKETYSFIYLDDNGLIEFDEEHSRRLNNKILEDILLNLNKNLSKEKDKETIVSLDFSIKITDLTENTND